MNAPPAPDIPAARHATLVPVAVLLVNAVVWGVSWLPFRYIDGLGMHALWATAGSYAVCTAIVLAWRPRSGGAAQGTAWLVLLALASGLTNAFFNWGVTIGEVVRVVLLFYLMPVWAALFARVLLGERITAGAAVRIGVAIAGAAVVLWRPGMALPVPESLADWLGVGGGAAFALTNVLLRRQAHASTRARALAMFGGACVVPAAAASLLAANGAVVAWPALDAPIAWAVLGTGAMLLVANLSLQYGAARLPSSTTAIVMLSEVVVAALSAAWLGDEPLGARTLAGGALILAASAMAAFTTPPEH